MANLSFMQLLNAQSFTQTQVGTALANSTTLTDITPGGNTAGQAFALNSPGSLQLALGQPFIVKANGIVSTTGTPNLTLGLYYGGVAGTALASTGATATGNNLSNATWELEFLCRVDAVGTSGSVRTIGHVMGPYAGYTMVPASSSSGNNVTVNTSTSSSILTIGAQWGTAAAGNSIQLMQFAVLYLTQGIS